MDEAVRKYGKWIVAAIFGIIALYFSTQVFLLASLPTDPRRAPDLPPEVETASFVVLPGDERVLESRQALAKAAEKICDARGCDFAVLLGSHILPKGMSRDDDPKMNEWVGSVYQSLDMPKYMILGDDDYGEAFDRRIGIREVRWATRVRGFEMPSSTYFFRSPNIGFWMFDTSEQCSGSGNMQTDWLTRSIASHPNVHTRIAFGHDGYHPTANTCLNPFFSDHVCGVFDLYLSVGTETAVRDECGTKWVDISPIMETDSAAGRQHPTGTFAWVNATKTDLSVVFFDKYGTLVQP